jgi:hypothetical protein
MGEGGQTLNEPRHNTDNVCKQGGTWNDGNARGKARQGIESGRDGGHELSVSLDMGTEGGPEVAEGTRGGLGEKRGQLFVDKHGARGRHHEVTAIDEERGGDHDSLHDLRNSQLSDLVLGEILRRVEDGLPRLGRNLITA